MATQPDIDPLNLREQLARIDKLRAETEKTLAEVSKVVAETAKASADTAKVSIDTRVVSYATVFQGLIAVAGLLGAGAAIAKLFFP
ncbi:MAG: hypothetical protein PGN12_08525 [Sphingomonas phyllosphaerae]